MAIVCLLISEIRCTKMPTDLGPATLRRIGNQKYPLGAAMPLAFDDEVHRTFGQHKVDESRSIAIMPTVLSAGYLPTVAVGAQTYDFLDGQLKGESSSIDQANRIAHTATFSRVRWEFWDFTRGAVRLSHALDDCRTTESSIRGSRLHSYQSVTRSTLIDLHRRPKSLAGHARRRH